MMSHGRPFRFLSIFVALTLVGCGTNGSSQKSEGVTRWNNFPQPIYSDPSIVKDSQSMSDFQDAMQFWHNIVGKQLFSYQGNWNGQGYSAGSDVVSQNAIFVQSPWSGSSNIAAQTVVLSRGADITGAVIMVNSGTRFCGGDCTGNTTSTSMRKVFAHELGHFLGLQHVQETANIMYPTALAGGSLAGLTVDLPTLQSLTN